MIVYGTQYYRPPYPAAEHWKDDLSKIKNSNFNTLKLWAVWSWIERKEGEFIFNDLDVLVNLCQEIGLNVVINTIPEGMPYWVSRIHADAKYKTHEGQSIEVSGAANMPPGGSPGLCPDKAEVQRLIGNFIATVVERYARRQHVIAFDVWNEPHIEPIWDYPQALFCYCEYSKARFLDWLKGKYHTLDHLNLAWARAYSGWEDVLPPVRFGSYPDMIDWRMFWIENLGKWLESRVEAAKKVANGKTVMTHVPFSGYIGGVGEGGLGQHLGDEFILSHKVDKFGLTSFPKWLMQNDFVQHLTNIELVASASGGKDFWQSELQSGSGKWEAFGRPSATPDEIRMWNWSAISCGAKGILYWQWRPEPSGTEAPGFGLTTLDGEISDRVRTAAECAKIFNNSENFCKAHRVPAINGIYVSRSSDLCLHAANRGEFLYAKGLYGTYKACFEHGIPVRMVHADQLIVAMKDGLQVLYAPVAVALSEEDQANLKLFVKMGGTLISEACLGLFDDRGVLRKQWGLLQEVFGGSKQEVDGFDRINIKFTAEAEAEPQRRSFNGRFYRQNFLEISSEARILAHFENGQPAVIENNYGRGRAIFLGSLPSLAVALDDDTSSADAICKWMKKTGYDQVKEIRPGKQVLFRMHQYQNQYYLTLANYSNNQQTVELVFNGLWEAHPEGCLVRATAHDGDYRLQIEISGFSGNILRLIKSQGKAEATL